MSADEEFEDDDDFEDEDADYDCSMNSDGTCDAAGSEDCDECPNNPEMRRLLREAREKAGQQRL